MTKSEVQQTSKVTTVALEAGVTPTSHTTECKHGVTPSSIGIHSKAGVTQTDEEDPYATIKLMKNGTSNRWRERRNVVSNLRNSTQTNLVKSCWL